MDDKNHQKSESYQKQPLPRWADERTESKQKWRKPLLALIALSALAIYTLNPSYPTSKSSLKCPHQPAPLHPKLDWTPSDAQLDRSADLLAQAVRIPTQSFDDNGEPNEDPRWAPFRVFQGWMKDTFSLAWETADVEFINELGILATFQGSDESLKPLILMSHYDVVPAPNSTADRWTHPAFSGFNDGKYIWGRGAADDKTLLVAQWEAITDLLEKGFKPRRTLILSHGFDEEEVFARRGQGTIAPFLEKRYGKDGILMVIDEGSGTEDDYYGAAFAMPNMGEKGYMDIKITVGTSGGHSSVPPKHTGIGIMADVVSGLEDNPFDNKLTTASPYLTTLTCAAEHAPSFPKHLAHQLGVGTNRALNKVARFLAKTSDFQRAMLGTTTAVDVINGGVKVNALPEVVTSLVNFRIDFDESIAFAQEHVEGILSKVAKKHDLEFVGFGSKGKGGGKFVKVEQLGEALEPAPRTPSEGPIWELFAGTVKASIPGPKGQERIVAPYISTGNTDCKMYYNLSKHIYRFMAGPSGGGGGVHTVNERSSISGHHQIVRWVHAIIQNTDAYTGQE